MAAELIATTATKKVYRDGDKAIKVFNADFPKAEVLNEALITARVEETGGIDVPKVLEVGVFEGKWSITFDFIEGKTLQQLMDENPDKLAEYMEQMVDLHLNILSKHCPLLNKLKDKMSRQILEIDELSDITLIETPLMDSAGFLELLLRFCFNLLVVSCIIHLFYYPKSKRRDYYFTFTLISISIFLMIFLLGSVKLKIGFALGLFAIFGIIRYRTESMPVREMTYLFVIIAISVINALAVEISYAELVCTNLLFIVSIWLCESNRWLKHISCKLIQYDRIELIKPERELDLLRDLRERTGLDIVRVEVGHIDFLRDTAMLKIYYEPLKDEINTIDTLTRLPRENE